jgi:hypothetical protein
MSRLTENAALVESVGGAAKRKAVTALFLLDILM